MILGIALVAMVGVGIVGRQGGRAVRGEAKTICEKYLSPPLTTDFAILFLPTEGLYAEVLRRPGLVDNLQREQRVVVTHKGASKLAGRGVFIQALAHRNVQVACACPDWSERRPHMGGSLGAALLQLFMQSGWLTLPHDSRALQLTAIGQRELHRFAKETELELA